MTDLEITKACAERIGLHPDFLGGDSFHIGHEPYDPLRNKAQCFDLIERTGLDIEYLGGTQYGQEEARHWLVTRGAIEAQELTLNRAVCLTVSRMVD